MFEVNINFIAVLVAAISSVVIGTLWYSPLLFGKTWIRLSNMSPAAMEAGKKSMAKTYIMSLLNSVVAALIMAYFIELTAVADILEAAILGVAIWLGFNMTALFASVIWEGKPYVLYLINTGYYLIAYVVMSVLITFITYR